MGWLSAVGRGKKSGLYRLFMGDKSAVGFGNGGRVGHVSRRPVFPPLLSFNHAVLTRCLISQHTGEYTSPIADWKSWKSWKSVSIRDR